MTKPEVASKWNQVFCAPFRIFAATGRTETAEDIPMSFCMASHVLSEYDNGGDLQMTLKAEDI